MHDSRLEQIEELAFAKTGLKSIEMPSSVIIFGGSSFTERGSLESVTFMHC
jgi:hypothetical protein